MYGAETFTVKGRPYLVVEMRNNIDENGKCCINVKILKHKSKECFNVVIDDMDKFDISSCKFLIAKDNEIDKTYEYITHCRE